MSGSHGSAGSTGSMGEWGLISDRYQKGDWNTFIISPGYPAAKEGQGAMVFYDSEDVRIQSYGSMSLNLKYGQSYFTDKKYRQFDEDKPVSKLIQKGFYPEQVMLLHMEGTVGQRMTVFIDHDSRREDNIYKMQYKAVRDDEIIREINAGQIDIKFDRSKYAVYDNASSKGVGLDVTVKKDNLQVKTFGSVTRGETEVEAFKGNTSSGSFKLADYQYVKRKYYQIEPFRRYDNLTAVPSGSAAYGSLTTFTSSYGGNYQPHPVNLDPSGFELYMDDQNPYNNYNAVKLTLDNGYYTKLVAGKDYTVNYSTGEVAFTMAVPENARIFAVYSLRSGTTSDPGVLPPGDPRHPGGDFSGRNFVFIKYGYSINEDADRDLALGAGEDRNNDGKLNLDIYEIRSVYSIGEKQLAQNNFQILFFRENQVLPTGDRETLGRYTVDYTGGLVRFIFREPFRSLLKTNYPASVPAGIYTERQSPSVYVDSHYSMKIDFFRDARSFKLKHFNVIPNSIRVKINGREIPEHLYSVDYTSGLLMFMDQNNPLIGPETDIEIRYEYLPFGARSQSFTGGIRTDYAFNRNLNLGGTLLYSRAASTKIIPNIGDTPSETLLYEGDASLHLDGRRLADFTNAFTSDKSVSVPVEINAYGEYARSIKKVNTFGKALIDNMESPDEIISVSLSEKDWILSSMPGAYTQGDRGILNYYFYRDPSHPASLKGPSYNATRIDYAVKPGPFNVATGHLDNAIERETQQKSLVIDFDFTSGRNVSAATRKLSDMAVDFSGLQYVEIWYKYEGTAAVNLTLDLGRINEDSDGDGVLDTEDVNGNGYLDTDPNAGKTEDTGYEFNGNNVTRVGSGPRLNSMTMGDGMLNSEDMNGNGILDAAESVYTLPSLTLAADDPSWKMKRIYIDLTGLTQAEIESLKLAEAVRINIQNSTGARGRVFIDSLRFISLRFRNPEMNGFPAGPSNLSVTTVNSLNDSEYRAEAFLFAQKDLYLSLYGDRTDRELSRTSESALQMDYLISAGNHVSVVRKFLKPLDLRFYRTMNLWFNYRKKSGNEKIGIVMGSSETDYVEYQFPMDYLKVWREARLRIGKGSSGDYGIVSSSGNLDLKRISYIKFIIYGDTGNSGSMWVNDIYVTEPEDLKSSAHWYEGELKIKRPIFATAAGVPVLSDINIKYIQKGHGAQFSTVGKTFNDVSENYKELFSSMKILPNWDAQVDYISEVSSTDSLNEDVAQDRRGKTSRNTLHLVSDFLSQGNGIPSVKVSYKHNNYSNRSDQYVTGYSILRDTEKTVHSPLLSIREDINDFLSGKLMTNLFVDMLYRSERVNRDSGDISRTSLSAITPLSEQEKRQKADANLNVNYTNSLFFVRPEVGLGTEEIVRLNGKTSMSDTEVLSAVSGDYHIPFLTQDSMKYTERNKKIQASAGIRDEHVISPKYKIELSYLENRFRDYDETEKTASEKFSRSRDARSFILSEISLPLMINQSRDFTFLKNLNLTMVRSLYFFETDVPYEGERTGSFDETYGIRHSLYRYASLGMNYYRYYPGYFLKGRGNYARGRDYVHRSSNEQLQYPSGDPIMNYNNQMRLIDNISLNFTKDFSMFSVNSGAGINQVSERQNVNGIPQQVVTRNISNKVTFDLMKIFSFGFFRPNSGTLPHHGASVDLGYNLINNQLITSNMEDNTHSPWTGITFKWDRSHIGFTAGLDYRIRRDKAYISPDDSRRSGSDDIYYFNMPATMSFREEDYGYRFSVLYETDINWIYNVFSQIYRLASHPIFSMEYSIILNRYDYTRTVSPEPYDQFLVRSKVVLDLHRNIQGGIQVSWLLERYRNRETSGISREILSYELAFNFSLIF